jgi:predicted RNA-binding protein YlxR (DUF448 family)
MPAVKHIPLRTCIACGKIRPQREMVRLASSAGGVELDTGAKRSGRGAYICRESECLQNTLNWKRVEKALRITLASEDKMRLAVKLKEFYGGEGK